VYSSLKHLDRDANKSRIEAQNHAYAHVKQNRLSFSRKLSRIYRLGFIIVSGAYQARVTAGYRVKYIPKNSATQWNRTFAKSHSPHLRNENEEPNRAAVPVPLRCHRGIVVVVFVRNFHDIQADDFIPPR